MSNKDEAIVAATAPLTEQRGSYVDWPAIIAGAVIASAIAAVFAGFGAALGLSAVSPLPGEGWGFFGVILFGVWMLVTLITSYMAGGYVAGRMRRRMDQASADDVRTRDGLHGLVVWALGALIGLFVLTGTATTTVRLAGGAVETGADLAARAASSVAGGAAGVVGEIDAIGPYLPDEMKSNPLDYINSTLLRGLPLGVPEPSANATAPLREDTRQVIFNILRTGDISPRDRAYLKSVLAERTTLSEEQVEDRIDQAVAAAQELRQEAERLAAEAERAALEAADAARFAAVVTGFTLAAAMLIAAVAAYFGATMGGRDRDEGRLYGGFALPLG